MSWFHQSRFCFGNANKDTENFETGFGPIKHGLIYKPIKKKFKVYALGKCFRRILFSRIEAIFRLVWYNLCYELGNGFALQNCSTKYILHIHSYEHDLGEFKIPRKLFGGVVKCSETTPSHRRHPPLLPNWWLLQKIPVASRHCIRHHTRALAWPSFYLGGINSDGKIIAFARCYHLFYWCYYWQL